MRYISEEQLDYKKHGCIGNYAGNKAKYLRQLYELLPSQEGLRVYDAFCGFGVISTSLPDDYVVTANDSCEQLIGIHKWLQGVHKRIGGTPLEAANFVIAETLCKVNDKKDEKGFEEVKQNYNDCGKPQDLYALATSSNSNYIRFNGDGEFNVKFGNRYLNPQLQTKLKNNLRRQAIRDIKYTNKDFRDYNVKDFDLAILDSPYSYNGKSSAPYSESSGQWQYKDQLDVMAVADDFHKNGKHFIMYNELITKDVENTILKVWSDKYRVIVIGESFTNSSANKKRGKDKQKSIEVLITNL